MWFSIATCGGCQIHYTAKTARCGGISCPACNLWGYMQDGDAQQNPNATGSRRHLSHFDLFLGSFLASRRQGVGGAPKTWRRGLKHAPPPFRVARGDFDTPDSLHPSQVYTILPGHSRSADHTEEVMVSRSKINCVTRPVKRATGAKASRSHRLRYPIGPRMSSPKT